MTYDTLLELIEKMTPEQREQNVTVFTDWDEEFRPVDAAAVTQDDDVLDANHFFLILR